MKEVNPQDTTRASAFDLWMTPHADGHTDQDF